MLGFPYYQQLEEMDCGAACLRMVARSYGRYYSLEYLREKSRISREGVSLLGISDAAEAIGMRALALEITADQLRDEIPLPCIIPWRKEHFVVLHKVKGDNYYLADPNPAKGMRKLSRSELIAGWSTLEDHQGQPGGTCLVLETTPEFFAKNKEGIDKSRFRYILSYFQQYKTLVYQLLAGLILGLFLQIILPFLIKNLIDVGIVHVDFSFIKLVIIAQGVLLLTMTLLATLRRWILLHIGDRVNISLISDFLHKLTRLPVGFFNSRMKGDLLQRINDHERVQRFLTGQTLASVFGLFSLVAFSIVLALWSWPVFFVFLLGTIINLAWILFFQHRKRDLDYRRFDQSAENQSQLMELIDGMQEIKLYGAERQKRWAWERHQASLYRTSLSTMYIDQLQRTGGQVINDGKNIIITLITAGFVLNGSMTRGMLVAIHYILAHLNTPIADFTEFMRAYQEGMISLERMSEIHNKEDEEDPDKKLGIISSEDADLSMDKVRFHYGGPHSPAVLRDVSLKIPRGKVTAIIGSSGSGKSTLIKLLLGFLKPNEGKVMVGETNLAAIENSVWRSRLGVVLQDGFIFSDTIARNIALGEEIIDEERLLLAVRIARIQSFIESLPMGYSTEIGQNGMGLSQGQKQRMLIARAIYRQPDYLFLDEATTGLNAFSEAIIMDDLLEYFRGTTVIVVAHRHSTIKQADQIIVLEGGEVIENGQHEDLMQQDSVYRQIIRNQLELGN